MKNKFKKLIAGLTLPVLTSAAHGKMADDIESRVDAIRKQLQDKVSEYDPDDANSIGRSMIIDNADTDEEAAVFQWYNWYNWGNWGDWNNWNNWTDFSNWQRFTNF